MADITVEELKSRLDKGEQIHLIDVREPWEREEFNIGGDLVPLVNFPREMQNMADLKSEEIVLYCRSGARSGVAKALLDRAGFSNARNLIGGMMQWQETFLEGS